MNESVLEDTVHLYAAARGEFRRVLHQTTDTEHLLKLSDRYRAEHPDITGEMLYVDAGFSHVVGGIGAASSGTEP